MSVDVFLAVFFVCILGIVLWVKRKNVVVQKALFPLLYVVMYRSTLGVRFMDVVGRKFPRFVRVISDVGLVVGFLGMIAITLELVWSSVRAFVSSAPPSIQPVLPIEAKGVLFVPFTYWILSIFLLAVVHELAHGIVARRYNVPVKSSGFAFLCVVLPVIPAAFVEPDERVLKRRSFREQCGVFAAGPFSNIVFALVMVGVIALFNPVLSSALQPGGVELVEVVEGGAAERAGLLVGDVITSINGSRVLTPTNLSEVLSRFSPGDAVWVQTKSGVVNVVLGGENSSQLGVRGKQVIEARSEFVEVYGAYLPVVLEWFAGLFLWLVLLNIGIGLFNLLPIGPLDGGRMLLAVLMKFLKEKTALRVWSFVSVFFVVLIVGSLVVGVLR